VMAAAVAKLFLWPLLALFAVGDRRRAALVSVVVAAAAVLASWSLIGFAGLSGYPRLLQELSRIESPRGYSPTALGLALGLPREAALALALTAGLPLLVAAVALARRPQSEPSALGCAVAAALALSPVVWLHYLVLLIVPIAAARERLGLVWFVPLLFWISPGTASNGSTWRIVLVLVVGALTLVLASRPAAEPRAAS
jgi:alpha-1,2-mannosyltransferase